jgi:hypothetical protein
MNGRLTPVDSLSLTAKSVAAVVGILMIYATFRVLMVQVKAKSDGEAKQKHLAYTKAQLLKLMADPNNIKTSSEKISELQVRVHGNAAVATYKDTYDILIMGQHRAHTIIATDTFVKMGGEWKQVASHGSEAR